MSGLETLKFRVNYRGGDPVQRLEQGKRDSLKAALKNSYQSETIRLADRREFKCLINPDKLHENYDNKIISIPFEDKCLNANRIKDDKIDLKPGDVFTWKETDTHWLVYLQFLEETSYFRAEIRKCDRQIKINGIPYWIYIRGPLEDSIQWNQKAGIEWNDLNYSFVMYITRDENTQDFFHRFTQVKIEDPYSHKVHNWKVTGKNQYYGNGIIQVFLDEDFDNSIKDAVEKEQQKNKKPILKVDKSKPYIDGPNKSSKYDTVTYKAINFTNHGKWILSYNGKTIEHLDSNFEWTFDINKSKGSYLLKYIADNEEAQFEILIEAF